MRFYKIQVASGPTFTSVVNGTNDPGALDVEFDINITQDQQQNGSHIKIKGIDPQLISQASNFNKQNLKMWVGYTNGLPIANAEVAHQGLIIDGLILPCFGNWIFNELSLEFFVQPGPGSLSGLGGPTSPMNIVHNMPAGQPLSTALTNTLKTAFPQATINMNISNNLKLNYPDYGIYQSLEQLGNYIKALSHSILGNNPQYAGVTISTNGNNIYVSDGTNSGQAININYIDLVGQPTWIGPNSLQIWTLMRGDINVPNNNLITLPQTLITQTYAGALGTNNRNTLSFQGTWKVNSVRHVGKFRNPSYDSWITIIEAVQNSSGSSAPSAPTNQSGQQTFTPSGAAPGSSGGIGMQ